MGAILRAGCPGVSPPFDYVPLTEDDYTSKLDDLADQITTTMHAPDVILASWCGKKVVPDRIRQRPGWSDTPAVKNDRIVEIKSTIILQPGPAALTDGLDAIVKALWAR